MISGVVTALVAAALAIPAVSAPGVIFASLPDPSSTGSITVVRLDHLGDPTTALVDVTVCLIRYNAAGQPLDLTTNIGWVHAAQLTVDDGAALADDADCLTQRTVGGESTFTDLVIGLWHVSLVYVDGGEVASEPFMTPIPRTADDGQSWGFDVRAYPKAFEPVLPGNRAAIRGTVWRNYANDGVLRDSESRVQGVRVSVYSFDPTLPGCPFDAPPSAQIASAPVTPVDPACLYYRGSVFTDADGNWVMRNLPAGTKVVRFLIQYAGPHYVFANTGPDFDGACPDTGLTNAVEVVYDEYAVVNAALLFTGPGDDPTPTPTPTPPPTPTPGPTPQPTPPDLPVTGAQIVDMIAVAAALIGVGFLVFISRKRKEAENA